jgi:hypothetical protein
MEPNVKADQVRVAGMFIHGKIRSEMNSQQGSCQ